MDSESTVSVRDCDRIRYRVLMLGLDNAGKTSVLFRLKNGHILSTAPTIGYHTELIKYRDESLDIWDIGGSTQLRKVWHQYFNKKQYDTHGILYVVDARDKERSEEAKQELHRLLSEDSIRGVPVVILANKQDKDDAMNCEEIKNALDIRNDNPCFIIGTSAITGECLEESLKLLIFGMKVYNKTRT